MPTITLKNIPKRLHKRLKERAERNHRSLNYEIITALEKSTGPTKIDLSEMILEARRLRRQIRGSVAPTELNEWKTTGRL